MKKLFGEILGVEVETPFARMTYTEDVYKRQGQLSDVIASSIIANLEAKQDILSEFDVNKRLIIVI